ncbi:MAG: hypothetical protein FWD64_11620, partial [Acidobacteriaceae bacterium]|nr:hypothetical protein [Acidobacteriaceae bacterium]
TEDKAMLRSNLSAVQDLRGDGRATETAARLCQISTSISQQTASTNRDENSVLSPYHLGK